MVQLLRLCTSTAGGLGSIPVQSLVRELRSHMPHGAAKKKKTVELPYHPAIPLLGIYPKKTKTLIRGDVWTSMFTAALFTIAKTWKQPKCPPTNEWIKKMWYIYIMEYFSAIEKNEILPFVTI